MDEINAVIYARYSSEGQREESIEGQIRECKEYAERNHIRIVGTYIDRALSGRTDARPEFQQMIKDSSKKIFNVVLVWKLDRFARNRYDSASNKQKLKKNNVRVVSAKENISSGPEGILMESILEGYAEYYSEELAVKVQRGQEENALKGKNNGGNTAIGYLLNRETKKLELDPLTAPLVMEVFERYAAGSTMKSIVDDFNARGLRTRQGTLFTVNSFNAVLKNRKYIGEYRYRDVVIPGGVPAIVTEELFDRVQRRLEKNKRAPARAKAKEEYLLTTKLFCGKCNCMMAAESGKSRNGEMYYYYKCGNSKRKKGCNTKSIKKDWLERAVVRLTKERVLTEENIARLIEALLVKQEEEDVTAPALRRQLKEIEKSLRNIMKAIEAGIFTATTKERLEELESQKENVTAAILTAELQQHKLTREDMELWFDRFRYGDPNSREYQKRLIDSFVNSVYVFEDKLVLTYNYQYGSETITFEEIEDALGSDLEGHPLPAITPPVSGGVIAGRR